MTSEEDNSLPQATLTEGDAGAVAATTTPGAERLHEVPPCWICHGTAKRRLLKHVCDCKGTQGAVHQQCIDHWVFKLKNPVCSACGKKYQMYTSYGEEGVPAFPYGWLHALIFTLVHFYLPLAVRFLFGSAVAVLRFYLFPMLLGWLFQNRFDDWRDTELLWSAWAAENGWGAALETWLTGAVLMFATHHAFHNYPAFLRYFAQPDRPAENEAAEETTEHAKPYPQATQAAWFLDVDSESPEPHGFIPPSDDDTPDDGADEGNLVYPGEMRMLNLDPALMKFLTLDMREAAMQDILDCLHVRRPRDPEEYPIVEGLFSASRRMWAAVGVPTTLLQAIERVGETYLALVAAIFASMLDWGTALRWLLGAAVLLRALFPLRPIPSSRGHERLKMAATARGRTSFFQIHRIYVVFMLDVALFSGVLPFLMGLAMHYCYTGLPTGPDLTRYKPSAVSLVGHWLVGVGLLMFVVRIEGSIMMVMFAPGIDFFVFRSVDLSDSQESWSWIHAQLLDADPLKIVFDFLRIGCAELLGTVLLAKVPMLLFEAVSGYPLPTLPWFGEPPLLGGIFVALAALLLATWTIFLSEFPIRRAAVELLLGPAKALAKALRLQRYLFDPKRLYIVERWLERTANEQGPEAEDDLARVLRQPTLPKMLVRREQWLALEGYRPRLLRLRLLVFCIAFFSCAALIPTVSFAAALAMAIHIAPTMPLLLTLGLCLPLLLLSPKCVVVSFGRAVVTSVMIFIVCIANPAAEMLLDLLTTSLQSLAEQVYDWMYARTRHVIGRHVIYYSIEPKRQTPDPRLGEDAAEGSADCRD